MKRTWKKRGIGPERVLEVVQASRTLSAAARTLGIDRSTLHRWIQSDASLHEAIRGKAEAVKGATEAADVLTPEAWAAHLKERYEPSDTELVVLDLAKRALEIARDEYVKPSERLAAMGRFVLLVRELNMEAPDNEAKAPTSKLYAIK